MKPLDAIRVLDFTEGAQGPFAASLLADFGADVVKIERPDGEMMRRVGPFRNGLALPVMSIARGRQATLALDMKNETDAATVKRLVAVADVLIQNWKPGTDEKLGLAFGQVHVLNPNIVYVQASGYGTRGPFGAMGAMDSLSQAMSGWSALSGDPAGGGERSRTPVLDFVSAFVTAEAAMVGLAARRRHARAVWVDTSQMSAALDAAAPEVAASTHAPLRPAGRRSRYLPLGGWFACVDGGFVSLECHDDEEVATAARVLGAQAGGSVPEAVEQALARIGSREAVARLRKAGLAAGCVEREFTPMLFDACPGTVTSFHDEDAGEIRHPETPFVMSETPLRAGEPLGRPGRDNPMIERLIADWQTRPAQDPQKD